MINQNRLLNVNQASEQLGIKPKTLYQRVWLGTIPYVKIGKSLRFEQSTIDEIIEAGRVSPIKEG